MMGFYQKMAADRAAKKAVSADGPQPKYRVLQADMLKQADREKAAAVATFVRSAEEAYKLAGQEGFAYKDLDLRRRVGVITYKGAEVALLFYREVVELEPGPADPVPQRALKDPKNAWIQIDLLDTDDVERKKGMSDRLRGSMDQVGRLQMLWQQQETLRKHLEAQIEKVAPALQDLSALKERCALLEAERKATINEIEGLKRDLREEKEARKKDKREMVQQMFPVFNTVWLAGLHRVGDKLYGIIKTQLIDALKKIGVSLIEPVVGDKFDPQTHHAVHATTFPEGSREIGAVAVVHRVGLVIGGVVVEAAEVTVGIEGKSSNEEAKSNGGLQGVETGSGVAGNNERDDHATTSGGSTEVG